MEKKGVELLPGTLEMLVLQSVTSQPRHGYGIARWIEDATGSELTIEEGALYPALHRIQRRGLVEAEWGRSELNRRAKFYRITESGREELARLRSSWIQSSMAVDQVLRAAP